MSIHTLSPDVPGTLNSRLEEPARGENRSVESEVIELLSVDKEGETDPEAIVAIVALLDEPALWRVARSRLTDEELETTADLNYKQQCDGLTADESKSLDALIRLYERTILVRARAAALLHGMGRDVSCLLVTT